MRKLARFMVPALMASAAITATASPASAGLDTACSYEELCVWKDANYYTPVFRFKQANPNWSFVSFTNLYNEDSAWKSRWTVPVVIYNNTQYDAFYRCLNSGQNLASNSANDDQGASHKWDGRGSC